MQSDDYGSTWKKEPNGISQERGLGQLSGFEA